MAGTSTLDWLSSLRSQPLRRISDPTLRPLAGNVAFSSAWAWGPGVVTLLDLERMLIRLGRLRTGTVRRAGPMHEDSTPASHTELIRRWVWTSTVP